MIRDLGLSTYCYLNHLPKNGLRYFFTNSHSEFDPTRCSEIGSNILPIFPTFQVDRARLDKDLWELNARIGIETKTGAQVRSVAINPTEKMHSVEYCQDGMMHPVKARWIINSSGRTCAAAPYFDKLSPASPDPDHHTAGAWGRYRNVKDIDTLGDDQWRGRVGHTSRYLSTNHFMGRGFWIWAIPIDRGVVSWGIVYDKDILDKDLTKQEDFEAFLMAHPFVGELLGEAEILDFQSHPSLSFKREFFCSKDRWAIVGDTHGFIDPFYSPGSDVLSRQAYLLDHLVTEENENHLEDKVNLINSYTHHEYQILRLLYVGQYDGFGSYEVFDIKSLWDFYSYTNRMVWNFMSGRYRDLQWMEREISAQESTLRLTGAIQNGFRALSEYLRESGLYERKNLEEYSLRQNRFRIEEEMLIDYNDDRALENHLYLCRLTISELIQARFSLKNFLTKRYIQDHLGFGIMSRFELTEEWLNGFLFTLSKQLERQIQTQFSKEIPVELTPNCLESEVPITFSTADEEIQEYIRELWMEPAVNPVLESLIDGSRSPVNTGFKFGRSSGPKAKRVEEEIRLLG
jgi:flavin-dependent dehydrogenase